MKDYPGTIDDIIAALVAHAADIGVDSAAIVEGGEVAAPPCINVLVAPVMDEEPPESGTLNKCLAEVEIRLITEGKISDKTTRRDAVAQAVEIVQALASEKIRIKNFKGFEFDTLTVSADNTVIIVEFQTYFGFA